MDEPSTKSIAREHYSETLLEFQSRMSSMGLPFIPTMRHLVESVEPLSDAVVATLSSRPLRLGDLIGDARVRALMRGGAAMHSGGLPKARQMVSNGDGARRVMDGVEIESGPPPASAGRGKSARLRAAIATLPDPGEGRTPERFVRVKPSEVKPSTVSSVVNAMRREGVNLRKYKDVGGDTIVVRDHGKAVIRRRGGRTGGKP